MPYVVCAEEMDGRWIAHVPDLPGCFTSHSERDLAIAAAPKAVEDYVAWCGDHGIRVSGVSPPMVVSEVVRAWLYEPEYEVNAFFAADRPPVTTDELPDVQRFLAASRKDLLQALHGLSHDDMQRPIAGERWPLAGIVYHVATSELWYLDRIGLAFPRRELSPESQEAIEQVRRHFVAQLPALSGQTGVVALAGEVWSARKVLRRTLWHERDHTQHILGLRSRPH
ncbi:MAG TPA: DinB family protein [Anaerolineales bacterium]|nr:DinB family protein [Anaerolineales bacterium]